MPKKSSAKSTNFSPRFVSGIKSQKWNPKNQLDTQKLTRRLSEHKNQSIKKFQTNHPHADQWFKQQNLKLGSIRLHSQKILTGASLSTALLLSAPASPHSLPQKTASVKLAEAGISPISQASERLSQKLIPLIPKLIGHLDKDTESSVREIIRQNLGISATSTLEGQHLNHSLGWIGYEQHLKRYPGDSLNRHDEEQRSGIAPGLGAWGYFANSQAQLAQEDILREKYYVAVQTLYIPTWKQDLKFLREWYKYRKVLVINIETGQAVTAVIGDAGPAAWTGKQFGGSPELMRALDLTGKKSKGKVLLYFVDESENTVPLGPVNSKLGEKVTLT